MKNNEQKIGDIIDSYLSRVNVVDGKVDFKDMKDAFWLIFKEYDSSIRDDFSNYAEKKSTIKSIEDDIKELQNGVELKAEKIKLDEIEIRLNENIIQKKNVAIWVSFISVFLSIVAICSAFVFKDVVIVRESIVLVFIGILATFIVVGNYIQTANTEQRFRDSISEIKIELAKIDDRTDEKIRHLKQIHTIILNKKMVQEVVEEYEKNKNNTRQRRQK